LDFCNAASATACIYLPANTTFSALGFQTVGNAVYAGDEDPLITDTNLCADDGGRTDAGGGCLFVYPVSFFGDFKPAGTLSTNASCDPPGTYVVDPKGAVKVDSNQSLPLTTGSMPVTCVVQVWMY
jgi:hypothetical protein